MMFKFVYMHIRLNRVATYERKKLVINNGETKDDFFAMPLTFNLIETRMQRIAHLNFMLLFICIYLIIYATAILHCIFQITIIFHEMQI